MIDSFHKLNKSHSPDYAKKTFDYEFIPGISLYSVRLGNYRYTKCSKCKKWAMFNITKNLPKEQKKLSVFTECFWAPNFSFRNSLFLRGSKLILVTVQITSIIILLFSVFIIVSVIFNLIKSKNFSNKIYKQSLL